MNDALHIAIAELLRAALIAALLVLYGLAWLTLYPDSPPHIIDPDPVAHPFSRDKGRVGCAPVILDDWLCFHV